MRAAFAFLTSLGGSRVPTGRTAMWFPVVGLVIGGAVGVVWDGAGAWWAPGLVAALAVVADLALTGMLHMDGVIDSADGLLPHLSRERRLEVMAEPTVGAFGVVAVVAVLLVRWAALASAAPDAVAVAGLWCVSRSLMVGVMASVPYARPGGLATTFGRAGAVPALLGLAVGGALAGWAVLGVVAGLGVVALAWRRLGGYTGDVLGAAGVLAETAGLVILAA